MNDWRHYKYFERAKELDKQVGETSEEESGQVGPCDLSEVCGDLMADRKTPPSNLGTDKFSSMNAETALDLVASELTRNRRLDRRVRAKPTEGNISVEQGTSVERSNKELFLTRQD